MKDFIDSYPDFPKKGVLFTDLSPIFANPKLYKKLIDKDKSYEN